MIRTALSRRLPARAKHPGRVGAERAARDRGMRRALRLASAAVLALVLLAAAAPARAEYRAYEIEVVDTYDCAVNKRERCRRDNVRTGLSPDTYQRTHGGSSRIAVLLLATWMCYGDTSNYDPVCPRPAPRNGKFSPGEPVQVKLGKHITDGWRGVVEVAYYQHSVRANVYGVRFPERQNVYARYYEKDLRKSGAPPAEQAQGGTAPAQQAGAPPVAAPAQAAGPASAAGPAAVAGPATAVAPAQQASPVAAGASPTQAEPPQ